uniref:Uncharacterized protein n=1 Tax=Meloidogyne enterolobii TaxID=390850 RepID=A0A6V7WN85_MELEN|nr:unnamed protein product [Meloidogyne enterolobii]
MAEVEQFKQNQNVINEEEKQQLEALNRSLFATIAEYTKIRNEHAKLIESQLCPIRCDIERRIRAADLDNFDKQKLGTVCNDLLNGLRQKGRQLCDLCDAIKMSSENLNQLKLCLAEWSVGSGKETKGMRPICSSFDMQKRLELLENHYEKSLSDFGRAKNDLDILDKHLEFNGNLLQSSSSSLQTDVLTPLEQHQLIRTNDNISKMCTKLETRIRQIRTQQELQELKKINKKSAKAGTSKLFPSKNSEDVASFCVLKLEQLNIFEDGKEGKVKMANTDNSSNFRQNLFNYMENHNLYKIPLEGNGIRQIQPIRPSLPSVANNQKVSKNVETDEQKLKNALLEGLKQPKKQLVSIGVQSPDFMALTPQKAKKTPTKTPKKPQTIIKTPETPKSTFAQTKTIEALPKNLVGYSKDFTTPTKSVDEPSFTLPENFTFNQQKHVVTEASTDTTTATSPNLLPTLLTTPSTTSIPTSTVLTPATTTTPNIASKQVDTLLPRTPPALLKENEGKEKTPEKEEEKLKENLILEKEKVEEVEEKLKEQQQPLISVGGDEGMEDEIIVAPQPVISNSNTSQEQSSISSVNFNFNMGGLGATSTPVNASRNPFGSIQPKPGGLFSGSPQSESWRSPFSPSVNTNQNNSGAFGSFGAISSGGGGGGSSGSSGFGTSPFGAAPIKPSVFGAAPVLE